MTLTNEEKEVIRRFYVKRGRIKTQEKFKIPPSQLNKLKKEWGLI